MQKSLAKVAEWSAECSPAAADGAKEGYGDGRGDARHSFAGTPGPTTVDCALAAWVVYMRQSYGVDLLVGNDWLQGWMEMYRGHWSFSEAPEVPEWMRMRVGDLEVVPEDV